MPHSSRMQTGREPGSPGSGDDGSPGIEEALDQLRQANPLLLVGLVGYLVFDQLTLWANFRAVGGSPELAVILIAYLIGQLGNWLPIPGGIGGVELGIVGALVLYGVPALTATAASCSTA